MEPTTADQNPYAPTATAVSALPIQRQPVSLTRVLCGFFLGFTPLILLAVIRHIQFAMSIADLPPDTGVCGTPVAMGYLGAFILSPILGLFSAGLAVVMRP